ncbi:DUF6232 family protein [Actinoplanes sp. NPDC089786]|uniref:DUF6232 family protein n=1 Tax=Actinoplanes sp. NPDC089786 TaxID=3155185 RepID=UPI00341961BF
MTVYYRSRHVVITEKLVKVRVDHGWRLWVVAELRGCTVQHDDLPWTTGLWALGSSAIVVGLVATRLGGWALPLALIVFAVAVAVAIIERRRARARSCSELRATYKGQDVVVFELPRREFDAACRGLIRAIERREDAKS